MTHSATTRGVHSLLYFAYTCVRDLFIGEFIYLAKKIIRCVVLLGTPLRGSLKVPHKPFGEGGLPWQVPKPNPGCYNNYACFDIVEEFDNCVVSFR
jgi:hypothetical protein